MANPEAILQIARLVGHEEFRAELGIGDGEEPADLTERQRSKVHELIDRRLGVVLNALVEEAMASDDVADSESAMDYLRDRMHFLGDLLSDLQRDRITEMFKDRVATWSTSTDGS